MPPPDSNPTSYSPRLLLRLLSDARQARASSIHLEPRSGLIVGVRLRVDGALNPWGRHPHLPAVVARPLSARLRKMAGLEASRALPQRGRFVQRRFDGRTICEVSTLPARWGEALAVHLLADPAPATSLEEAGLDPSDRQRLEEALERPGLIVVCGPHGSGRRALLRSCLARAATEDRVLSSITAGEASEDVPGVVQVEVRPERYFTREKAFWAALGADPDGMRIDGLPEGLIDPALRAALEGVLVLASFAARDAAHAVLDLLAAQSKPFLVTQGLALVVATRRARALCGWCKAPSRAPGAAALRRMAPRLVEERLLVDWEHAWQRASCPRCEGTGHAGVVPLHEVLPVTPELVEQVREQPYDAALATLRGRTRSLREVALLRAAEGAISVPEALRVSA